MSDCTLRTEPWKAGPANGCLVGAARGSCIAPEEKLLFILVYLKTYPLQVVMGELFDLSQPQGELLDSSAVAGLASGPR